MANIRLMTMEDYKEVYDLWLHTPGMGLNTTDDSRDGVERFLRRNPTSCFVAEQNGRIVGALLAGHDGKRGYIYHAAVAPDARKNGIAKQLVDRAIDALDQEGICKVALIALRTNATGNAFWEKIGFSERSDLIYRDKLIRELEFIEI